MIRPSRNFGRAVALSSMLVLAASCASVPVAAQDGDSNARVRSGDVVGRASIRCAQERGQAWNVCDAEVARGERGAATVVVRFANGFSRTLHFADGAFVKANATMSGNGTDTDHRIDGAHHLIRVDDQRYEVPLAFVSGD